MSFIILGSEGFVAKSLKNFLVTKNKDTLAIGKKKINFLKKDSALKLKKTLRNKKNYTLIITSSIAPAKNLDDYLDNLKIIKNIINGINIQNTKKIIYISSDAVYSDTRKKITENSPTAPNTMHGMMHLHRESLLKSFFNKKLLIIRPTLLYGKNDTHNSYGPNKFMRNLINNDSISLFGKGEERRDHVYIGDLVKIIYMSSQKKITGTLNVVSSKIISFYNLAIKAKDITKSQSQINFLKRNGPMHHLGLRQFNNYKLKKEFINFNFSSIEKNLKEYL